MRLTHLVLALALLVAAPGFVPPALAAPTVRDGVLVSFDGTKIVYTFFLPEGASAANPVPLVMMTHGWAGSRTATPTGMVGELLARGFAVVTWDSRGFGQSGGFVELDSPDYEVKDAIALLDLIAANPAILKVDGDPVVGMAGGSYAGQIQLLTAAFDPRIDAIVPDITWNDLRYSLAPYGVPKVGWIEALFGAGAATGTALGADPRNPAGPDARSYGTNLPSWWAQAHATNEMSDDAEAGLAYRSISQYMEGVDAAVLLTQGWTDTLFTPNEAIDNFLALREQGNDVSLILYCGGHAGCPYVSGGAFVRERTLAFLEATLKDGAGARGPAIEWQDNEGGLHGSDVWPPAGTTFATASGTLRLASTPAPTGGGSFTVSAGGVNTGRLSMPVEDERATSGLIPILTAGGPTQVTGVPRAQVEVTGVGTEAFLFFRLVDATTGAVLDDQVQALRLPVGGSAEIDLVGVSYVVPAGHQLALQVATSDFAHATNRQPGLYDVTVSVEVPVV